MEADLAQRLAGRRVVASISGGKDSAAMSLHLTELGIEHDRVFCDTGWEAPETYEHLAYLAERLGPITHIRGERQFEALMEHKGMFPSRTRRFCTEELKVRPLIKYFDWLMRGRCWRCQATGDVGDGPPEPAGIACQACNGTGKLWPAEDPVNAVGIRRGESAARSRMPEWEESKDFDCEVWRPLIHWTEQQVIDIHARHGLRPNPLYLRGASRVGCLPCIFARKSEVRMIAEQFPEQIVRIRKLEKRVQAGARQRLIRRWMAMPLDARINARAGGDAPGKENAPTLFQSSSRMVNQKRPCIPIDAVVSWSKTSFGGRQFELFAGGAAEEGCMRWGLCETSPAATPPTTEREPGR